MWHRCCSWLAPRGHRVALIDGFDARAENLVTLSRSDLTRTEQIQRRSRRWRRRPIRDPCESRQGSNLRRDRRDRYNREPGILRHARMSESLIRASGHLAATCGILRRSRWAFRFAAVHAVGSDHTCNSARRTHLQSEQQDEQTCQQLPHQSSTTPKPPATQACFPSPSIRGGRWAPILL